MKKNIGKLLAGYGRDAYDGELTVFGTVVDVVRQYGTRKYKIIWTDGEITYFTSLSFYSKELKNIIKSDLIKRARMV
jgi:hypothetical protein